MVDQSEKIWPPREFFQTLLDLCKEYHVSIDGSEWGLHFSIKDYGLYHVEKFDEDTTNVDEIELD